MDVFRDGGILVEEQKSVICDLEGGMFRVVEEVVHQSGDGDGMCVDGVDGKVCQFHVEFLLKIKQSF